MAEADSRRDDDEGRDERPFEPEDLAELRRHMYGQRQHLAELRQHLQELTARGESLGEQMIGLRRAAAEQAEGVADQAEAYADHLDATAAGPDRDQRIKLAKREREIAALERRNAARLREAGTGPVALESPGSLNDEPEQAG